ncbi:hypothetical protein V8F20_002294 [Naviculisporaceae sp. PSN 640]
MEWISSQQKNVLKQQGGPENRHSGIQYDTSHVDMIDINGRPSLAPSPMRLSGNGITSASNDTTGQSAQATSATIPADRNEYHPGGAKSVSNAFDEPERVSREERSHRRRLEKDLLNEKLRRQLAEGRLQAEMQRREETENLLGEERYRRQKAEELMLALQRWKEEAIPYFRAEEQRRETAENWVYEERRLREAVEKELEDKSAKNVEIQKRCKEAARELNKMRSQQQGFHIVTDDYLVERTNSLRYSIQTFAIQYFEGEAPKFQRKRDMPQYFVGLLEWNQDLKADLSSPKRRADAIQAIVWSSLVELVFDNFLWLPKTVGYSVTELCNILRPEWQRSCDYTGSRDADIERKFQAWNASTAAFLADLADDSPQRAGENSFADDKIENRTVFRVAWDFFRQIPTSSDTRGLSEGLLQIFRDAIELDKEINKQVARIEWDFGPYPPRMKFDPQSMTATKVQEQSATTDEVRYVIAPRMIKRGKSTGGDFEIENQLLPMEVSLMPVPETVVRGHARQVARVVFGGLGR